MMENERTYKRNGIWLFLFSLIFIFGFIVGAFVQNGERISSLISGYAGNVVLFRLEKSAVKVFLDTVVSYFVLLIIICLIGFCKSGIFLNTLIVLCLGMGKGALISSLVCDSGIKGLCFSVLALLPGTITAVCAVLFFASGISALCIDKERERRGRIRRFLSLFINFLVVIFSAGLDVTFAKLYKVFIHV